MRPLLWFLLGLIVAISGQALAEGWVNEYGNSLDYQRGYYSQPGQPSYQDSKGTMHYPPPINNGPSQGLRSPGLSHRNPC